jgi:hypothetical protein
VIPRQILQYALAYVPPHVVVAGALVFGAFHVWSFYNDALMMAADTRLKNAKASVEEAKAMAANFPSHGDTLRVATMRAEVAKKEKDAELGKIEADAQTSRVNGEEAALAKAKADLSKKQAEAANAKLAADAASAKFGVRTLAERSEFVKFIGTEMANMISRYNVAAAQAGMEDSTLFAGYADRVYPGIIDAMCKENALAKYLGCPKKYVKS